MTTLAKANKKFACYYLTLCVLLFLSTILKAQSQMVFPGTSWEHRRPSELGLKGSNLEQLAESLGWDRFVVAGHSLGGAIALAAAVYHMDMMNGLMLIDTGARLRVHPDILKDARKAAQTGKPIPLDRSWAYANSTPQIIIDDIDNKTADIDPWVTYRDWICDDSFDFTTRLKDIDVPALAICGEEDKLTPLKYHQFFQQKMPQCQLAVIKNAGHWSYVEQPEEFKRVVKEFLDSLPAL